MSAKERSDRRQTALRATPCNRKQQWGELQKKRRAKQVTERPKKKVPVEVKGGEKLRKQRVDRMLNAVEKSKRMRTNKIHWILQKG